MSLLCKTCAYLADLCALLIVCAYGWLAYQAAAGSQVSALALDPTWAAVQRRGVLRVAADVGWRPFADERGGQIIGYDVDLARELGRRLGVQVVFVPTGYDALYDALTSGSADMVASALPYAPEQGERARFSEFYFNAGQVLVVRRAGSIASQADLSGRRLGAALGSDADNLARRLASPASGISVDNHYDEPAQVLAALVLGRLDAALVDNVAALTAVQQDTRLQIIEPALTLEPYVLAMPPQAFQLQNEVNRVLAQLQAEGFLAELNRRWLR